MTKLYYQQNPAARNKVAPCLENQLKRHKIWQYEQTWVILGKDSDVQTIADIEKVQNEMASYEVHPKVYSSITQQLIQEEIKDDGS